MKTIILTAALFCTLFTLSAQVEKPVMLDDLETMTGEWKGTMETAEGTKMEASLLCERKNNKLKITSTHTNNKGRDEKEVSIVRVSDGNRMEYDGDWLITKSKIDPNGDLIKLVLQRGDRVDGEQAILKRTIEANGSKLYIIDEIQHRGLSNFKLKQKCSYKKV